MEPSSKCVHATNRLPAALAREILLATLRIELFPGPHPARTPLIAIALRLRKLERLVANLPFQQAASSSQAPTPFTFYPPKSTRPSTVRRQDALLSVCARQDAHKKAPSPKTRGFESYYPIRSDYRRRRSETEASPKTPAMSANADGSGTAEGARKRLFPEEDPIKTPPLCNNVLWVSVNLTKASGVPTKNTPLSALSSTKSHMFWPLESVPAAIDARTLFGVFSAMVSVTRLLKASSKSEKDEKDETPEASGFPVSVPNRT